MNKSQNIFYNNKLEKSFKKKSEEEKSSEYKSYKWKKRYEWNKSR